MKLISLLIVTFLLFACTSKTTPISDISDNDNFLKGTIKTSEGENVNDAIIVLYSSTAPLSKTMGTESFDVIMDSTTSVDGSFEFDITVEGYYSLRAFVNDSVVAFKDHFKYISGEEIKLLLDSKPQILIVESTDSLPKDSILYYNYLSDFTTIKHSIQYNKSIATDCEDIDGDGIKDFIYTIKDSSDILASSLSTFNFSNKQIYNLNKLTFGDNNEFNYTNVRVETFTIADINNDNTNEIIISPSTPNLLILEKNSDEPSFILQSNSLPRTACNSLNNIDINSDNYTDIITSTGRLYLNTNGQFSKHDIYIEDTYPSSSAGYNPEAIDINGDYNKDVIITFNNLHSLLYINEGAGHFTQLSIPCDTVLAYADFDGDNDLDLLCRSSNTISVFYNNNSVFSKVIITELDTIRNDEINAETFDKDNDGDIDIVLYYAGHEKVIKIIENQSGSFSMLETNILKDGWATLFNDIIILADITSNGYTDIICYDASGLFHIIKNIDGASFEDTTFPEILNPRQIKIFDIHQDNDLDIFILEGSKITILYNNGDGSFQTESIISTESDDIYTSQMSTFTNLYLIDEYGSFLYTKSTRDAINSIDVDTLFINQYNSISK